MVSVLPNSSATLLDMYLRHAALLSGPAVTCTWERCACTDDSAYRVADRWPSGIDPKTASGINASGINPT